MRSNSAHAVNPFRSASRAFALHHGNWSPYKPGWPQVYFRHHRVSCVVSVETQLKIFRGLIYRLPAALWILAPPPQHSSPSSSFFLIPADRVFYSETLFFIASFFFDRGIIFFCTGIIKKIARVTVFPPSCTKQKPGKNGNWVWNSGIINLFFYLSYPEWINPV